MPFAIALARIHFSLIVDNKRFVRKFQLANMLGINKFAFLVYAAAAFGAVGHSAFTLSDIEFHSITIYSTPAHLAVEYGKVHFNLTNSATPFVSVCAATEQQAPNHFYGNRVYPCSTDPGNSSKTTFSYNRLENLFHVNQTWSSYG